MAGDRMKNANHSHITEQLSGPWQCHWAQPSRLSLQELPIADRASGQQWRHSGRREEDSRSRWKILGSASSLQLSDAAPGCESLPRPRHQRCFNLHHTGLFLFLPRSIEAPAWRNTLQPRWTWGRVDAPVCHFGLHTLCCFGSLQLFRHLGQCKSKFLPIEIFLSQVFLK